MEWKAGARPQPGMLPVIHSAVTSAEVMLASVLPLARCPRASPSITSGNLPTCEGCVVFSDVKVANRNAKV
jgi:hypothetical protein